MALQFLYDGYFAGKVGIGTESPLDELQIGNYTGSNSLSITSADGANYAELKLREFNNNYGITFKLDSNLDILNILYHNNSTSGQSAMAISRTTGNVGIGTTGPAKKLHVLNSTNEAQIRLGQSGSGSYDIGVYTGDKFSIGRDADTQEFTLSAGNVGIGTTAPGYKLDVAGEVRANNLFRTTDGTNIGLFGSSVFASNVIGVGSSNAVPLVLGTSATERMRILANGNVGIGTTNPIGCLDIDDDFKLEGNLRLGDSSVYTGGWARGMITLYQNTSTGSKNFVRQGMLGNSDALSYYWHSMDPTTTTPWSVNAFRIYPNNDVLAGFLGGKVGIGTTSPTQKLHVVGNARVTGAYYDSNNSSGTANQVLVSTVTGTDWIDGSAIPGVPAGSGTLNTVAMWTPDGDTLGDSHITQNTNDIFIPRYLGHTGDGNNYIGFPANDVFNITTAGNQRFRVNADGNIGIGVTGPSNTLHVFKNSTIGPITSPTVANAGLRIQDNGASLYVDGNSLATDSAGYLTTINNNHFDIGTNSTSRIHITSGGDVGIGDTTPSEKLDVAGNIKIQAALLSNQDNTDVDTGTETVANVAIATYTAAFFDFVIKKTTNVRSGTVYACHDGTNVEFTETSTQDLGDTSDVTLSVDISGTNMRLRATSLSESWSVKSLIRAI